MVGSGASGQFLTCDPYNAAETEFFHVRIYVCLCMYLYDVRCLNVPILNLQTKPVSAGDERGGGPRPAVVHGGGGQRGDDCLRGARWRDYHGACVYDAAQYLL